MASGLPQTLHNPIISIIYCSPIDNNFFFNSSKERFVVTKGMFSSSANFVASGSTAPGL
jgi:hypothetical protein